MRKNQVCTLKTMRKDLLHAYYKEKYFSSPSVHEFFFYVEAKTEKLGMPEKINEIKNLKFHNNTYIT